MRLPVFAARTSLALLVLAPLIALAAGVTVPPYTRSVLPNGTVLLVRDAALRVCGDGRGDGAATTCHTKTRDLRRIGRHPAVSGDDHVAVGSHDQRLLADDLHADSIQEIRLQQGAAIGFVELHHSQNAARRGSGWCRAGHVAYSTGAFAQGWFHVKLAAVLGLSAYHVWLAGYHTALLGGERKLSGRKLRMLNEIPGIAAALIVIMVVLRPF